MTPDMEPDPTVSRLPRQIRPMDREGVETFIVRLAQANHLQPAYLRDYLCPPPHHRGKPSWGRLAAATGRHPAALREALEGPATRCAECDAPLPPKGTAGGSPRRHCSARCRQRAHLRRTIGTPTCGYYGIELPRTSGKSTPSWCSPRCRRMAHRQGVERPAEPPAATASPAKLCTKCGEIIHRIPMSRRGPADYCQPCRDQDYLQRQQNPAQPLAGHSVPTGPTCGLCRTPLQAASAARRWCSHACRQAAYRARKLGELPATALSRQNRAT